MPNLARLGFRWVQNKYAPDSNSPPIEIMPVADDYAVKLCRGVPVILISDGTIQIAAPGNPVYGIFDGAKYFDGNYMRRGGSLPAATSYDTLIERQSMARIIRPRGQLFRATCDENTTATTLAAYLAFVGENVEWAAGTNVQDEAGSVLDISGHAVTDTLSVRIENIPDRELQDFTATGVSLLVSFNLISDTASGAILGV